MLSVRGCSEGSFAPSVREKGIPRIFFGRGAGSALPRRKGAHGGEECIRLGAGVVFGKAHAHQPFLRRAERKVHARRTVQPAAHRDAVFVRKRLREQLRLHVRARKGEDAVRVRPAVHPHPIDAAERFSKVRRAPREVRRDALHARQEVQRAFRKGGDGGAGEGARFQAVGVKGGHVLVKTHAARAAVGEGGGVKPRGEEQRARALDALHALVPRHAERVDARFPHVDGHMSACLRAVAHEQDALGQKRAHGGGIDGGARHVGGERMHGEQRLPVHRRGDRLGAHRALRQGNDGQRNFARALQGEQGAQHRIVLHRRRYDVRTCAGVQVRIRAYGAEERHVQRLGAVFREDDAFRARPAEKAAQQPAGAQHVLRLRERRRVPAPPGVGAYPFDARAHGALHAVRFSAARRGVVKVNQRLSPFRGGAAQPFPALSYTGIRYYYMPGLPKG